MVKSDALLRMEQLRKEAERGTRIEAWGYAGIMLLPVGLALLFCGSRKREKANEEMDELYREVYIREPLEENFENTSFEPYEGFSEEMVEGFQICRMGNEFDSEAYGKGDWQDVHMEMSDVTIQDYDRLARKDNITTLFKGRMIVLHFPKGVLSEKVAPQLKERLERVAARHQGADMKVLDDKLILAINDGDGTAFYRQKKKEVSLEAELTKVQEDMDDIKAMIELIR